MADHILSLIFSICFKEIDLFFFLSAIQGSWLLNVLHFNLLNPSFETETLFCFA